MEEKQVHVVIVTGLSGSGKSTAIKAFEDIDYFCIDNLPVPLLPEVLALCRKDMPDIQKIALGIDIRERKFLKDYDRIFKTLEDSYYHLDIIFLETSTEILQRRFSQTRRMHPLASSESHLLDAIHQERQELQALHNRATRIVDTSNYSVHQLKDLVSRTYSLVDPKERLSIQVLSFGFKYGLPFEADLVMDVRFLPNPYFIEELKGLTGESSAVREWVLQWPVAQEFVADYSAFLLKRLPYYIQEGRRYLTIAFGCTGGKHRSVVMAEQIADGLRHKDYFAKLFHRDIYME
jgi:UPF0042 nucleotide-binding protein